ncbi:hypothetical protein POVCU2_0007630 [Plasmodium ovale curtisi]|uniref:PIR Superfamily Protein n=1 Tax=Plasmodium ovale curtisi TaxID=864141 RepID=A0A1A8VQ65_PLAOA|nr:hypothetical protein POVCU2_0007630 [Plasmodium ovale curtisi]
MNSTARCVLIGQPTLKYQRNKYNIGHTYVHVKKMLHNFCEPSSNIKNNIDNIKKYEKYNQIVAKNSDNLGDEQYGEARSEVLQEDSSPYIKTTSTGLSVSGVLDTGLLFLHKTTPLGSYVNTKILNHNIISSLDNHKTEDLVMDNFDPLHSSLN